MSEKSAKESKEINDLNLKIFGQEYLSKTTRRRAKRDIKSYWYLLKKFKLRELYNFWYLKFIVPTGEGFFHGFGGKNIRKKDKAPLPKYIELEPTTVCNKKCYICEYVHWPANEQIKRNLTLEEYKYIIDQFKKIRWSNITGEGSSFLNKDYAKILQYLHKKHKASIWFVDHLSDVSFDFLEKEILPYVHGIYVSMDAATKETYEKTKINCNFDNVVNNLKKIIEYKRKNKTPFPHITFRYIILKDNVNEIPQFLDLINSIAEPKEWGGSSSITEFTGLLYFEDIKQYYVERIPSEVITEVLKRKDGMEFVFSHAEEDKNPPIECCTAWLEPYIMLPGYVMPCCAVMMSNRRPFLRKYSFGNVFKDKFKDIWNNEYYKKFKKIVNDPNAPVPKICAGCRAYRTQERIKKYGVWDVYRDETIKHTEINELDLTIPND